MLHLWGGGVACHCPAAVIVLLRDVAECPPQSPHQVTLFCILCPFYSWAGHFLPYLGERGIYLPKCRVAVSGWECCQCLLSPILFYVAIDFCQSDSFYTWLAANSVPLGFDAQVILAWLLAAFSRAFVCSDVAPPLRPLTHLFLIL